MKRLRIGLLILIAALLLVEYFFLDSHPWMVWYLTARPGRFFSEGYSFDKCSWGIIEHSFAGDMDGYICRWHRQDGDFLYVREERYMGGFFWIAFESAYKEEQLVWMARLHPRSKRMYMRCSEYGEPHFLELVERGVVTSRYESDWERFSVDEKKVFWSIPLDVRRASGRVWPEVENFLRDKNRRRLKSLRTEGYDLSQPLEVAFKFYYPSEPPAQDNLWSALADHGCFWRPEERRIFPQSGHCTMSLVLTEEILEGKRVEFVELAKSYNGKFGGWSLP